MKKKLTIFLIILVTSLCSVFAVEMSYYLISNDSTISLAMDEYRYTDRTFNRVWSSSYKKNTGKFKVTCNAGTELVLRLPMSMSIFKVIDYIRDFPISLSNTIRQC